jgi:hypothetical protein
MGDALPKKKTDRQRVGRHRAGAGRALARVGLHVFHKLRGRAVLVSRPLFT